MLEKERIQILFRNMWMFQYYEKKFLIVIKRTPRRYLMSLFRFHFYFLWGNDVGSVTVDCGPRVEKKAIKIIKIWLIVIRGSNGIPSNIQIFLFVVFWD